MRYNEADNDSFVLGPNVLLAFYTRFKKFFFAFARKIRFFLSPFLANHTVLLRQLRDIIEKKACRSILIYK